LRRSSESYSAQVLFGRTENNFMAKIRAKTVTLNMPRNPSVLRSV
jgi:hypothetical protein